MHQELANKAVDVLEQNEILKKDKKLAVAEYNSLKDRNKFLKAMLAKAKKAEEGGVQEEQTAPSSEHHCSATMNPALYLHNQTPIVPCFWPPILPSSEGFQFQYPAGSNPMSSSQFPMLCSLQGQENAADINRQGAPTPPAPLFVVAVPWLLPFVSQSSAPNFNNSGTDDTQNADPLRVDNNQLSSSNRDMNAEASNSRRRDQDVAPGKFTSGRPVESLKPSRSTQLDVSSAPESTSRHNLLLKSQEPVTNTPKKAEDAYAATVARWRRKELMRLKNMHCEYSQSHYLASG